MFGGVPTLIDCAIFEEAFRVAKLEAVGDREQMIQSEHRKDEATNFAAKKKAKRVEKKAEKRAKTKVKTTTKNVENPILRLS